VGILGVLRVLVVFLFLHLELPGAIFGHHIGAKNLHVINDEFKTKEGVLFVLTLEIFNRDQHVFD